MGRAPCCDEKLGLKKGPWTPDEDQKLVAYIEQHGHGSWRTLPENAGLLRCGKSCRLRWTNYLRPDIKRGRFSEEEDQMIVNLHALLGNRWSAIASHLPRRTDNEIKNYWNTHLKKRLMKMGIDPATHKPSSAASHALSVPWSNRGPGLRPRWLSSRLDTHLCQWDCARAEADARLSTTSNLNSKPGPHHPDYSSSSSANFMSAWKALVAETLRPTFGTVELERKIPPPNHPINFQTSLQDWDQSSAATQPFQSRNLVSSYQCPPPMDPQLPQISSAASQAVAPHPHYWNNAANQPTVELGSSMFPPAAVRIYAGNQLPPAVVGSSIFSAARIAAENQASAASSSISPAARMEAENQTTAAGSSIFSAARMEAENQTTATGSSIFPAGRMEAENQTSAAGSSIFSAARMEAENQISSAAGSRIFLAARIDTDAQSSAAGSSVFSPAQTGAKIRVSPATTPHGLELESSNLSSPGSSSSTSTRGSHCLQEFNMPQGSYHSFPLIHPNFHDHKPSNIFWAPGEVPAFWHRQQAAMVESLQPGCFSQELGAVVPPQEGRTNFIAQGNFGVPNNIEIPQFDSLCRGVEDPSKFTFDPISFSCS